MLRPLANITTRLFLWGKKFRSPKTEFDLTSLKSIVCIETSRMGDVILAIPLLYSFYKANPQAPITVITDVHHVDIIRSLPFVSVVIGLENTATGMGFLGARRLVKRINADLAVSVSPSHRNTLLTLSTTAKYKIGYFTSMSPMTPFLFKTKIDSIGFQIKHDETYWMENIQERSLKIARALGIPVFGNPVVEIFETSSDAAMEALRRLGINSTEYVIIHPFSGWEYRNWDVNNYLSVAEKLCERNIHTIIIGNEADSKKIDMNLFKEKKYLHPFFNEKLSTVAALMKRSSAFIGNDSGPLHLASALGVKCVGLFGPASPHLTAPVSDSNIYLYEQVECSPCEQIGCIRPGNPCMNLISIDLVMESVRKLLDNKMPGVR